MESLQNVCLAHLQLLMNTSAKYQANWTETVGGVVRTRFCGHTDRPNDRPTGRPTGGFQYTPPPHTHTQTSFAGGIKTHTKIVSTYVSLRGLRRLI